MHEIFSPSSVVAVVGHLPLSSQGRTCEKNQILAFFKNRQSFQNSRFLVEMSVRVFFGFMGRRRRRSSVISLFRHRDGPVKKNQIFTVFQKQAIFPKFKIFRQNECTRFFHRRRSSLSSVVGHLPLSSQGRTCEKNQIFAVFQKQAIFPKFKIFRQNECTRFFRRRQFSLISLFRHRDGPVKKIKFSPVFHRQAIFPKFKIIRQNECTRFFRRRRSSPSSVVCHSLVRHRDGPVKKNQIFRRF